MLAMWPGHVIDAYVSSSTPTVPVGGLSLNSTLTVPLILIRKPQLRSCADATTRVVYISFFPGATPYDVRCTYYSTTYTCYLSAFGTVTDGIRTSRQVIRRTNGGCRKAAVVIMRNSFFRCPIFGLVTLRANAYFFTLVFSPNTGDAQSQNYELTPHRGRRNSATTDNPTADTIVKIMCPTARGADHWRPARLKMLMMRLLLAVVIGAAASVDAKQMFGLQQQHAGFVATSSLGVGFHQHSWTSGGGGGGSDSEPSTLEPLEQPPDRPRFVYGLYNVSIAENSVGKTYAVQPPAEDRLGIRIANDGLEVRFRIVGGDKEKLFKAEDRRVGDFAFLAIRTRTGNVILNREKIEEYRLDVRATFTLAHSVGVAEAGGDAVPADAVTQVAVRVLDTNDLSPMFYPNEYSVTIPEDMALHKSILHVIAEDADLGINGEIYYSFLDDGNDYFAVHPSSGVITLTRPLKFTDRSFHELVVVATDRGASGQGRMSQASKARVHVKIKQVSTEENIL